MTSKKDKHKDEAEQQNLFMAQLVQQQAAEIESQLNQIELKRNEIFAVLESIDKLNGKKNSELMIPLSSEILAKAELKDDKNFLVSVGAGVLIEKKLDAVKSLLHKQLLELEKAKEIFEKELQKLFSA